MRVLFSSVCSFYLSRKAVLRARELDASWASPDRLPLIEEPKHFAYGREKISLREEHYSLGSLVPRHDPVLLQVFDELGEEEMSGWEDEKIHAVEVPDEVHYFVSAYLGEWIAEAHRVWDEDTGTEGRIASGPVFTKESKFSDFVS